MLKITCLLLVLSCSVAVQAQPRENVRLVRDAKARQVDVFVGKQLFTSFRYPETLEKPVLFPLYAASGAAITRGFPLAPRPDDPTDHPHHVGMWFNFENVNGLDFWNNSYAIAPAKRAAYGWIKTDQILQTTNGPTGSLTYHANWVNQQQEVLLEETTRFEFSGTAHRRVIDRVTTLKAATDVTFRDTKDGLLGLRLAHELQMPTDQDQTFTDASGNVTVVKGGTDRLPSGTYLTSAGKRGHAAWGTRAAWCQVAGKLGADSVSVAILDHPTNPHYPTCWHARGYGLFAANPLGERFFTKNPAAQDLHLPKGESVRFRFRVIIDDGPRTLTRTALDDAAAEFATKQAAAGK